MSKDSSNFAARTAKTFFIPYICKKDQLANENLKKKRKINDAFRINFELIFQKTGKILITEDAYEKRKYNN